MSFLILRAYLKLIQFDLYLARGNFAALHDKVRNYPVEKMTPAPDETQWNAFVRRSTWLVSGIGKRRFVCSARQRRVAS